jgi:hypothetical protein
VIAYKFLRPDGTSAFTGFRWELPDGAPGDWVQAHVDPCASGIHACLAPGLPLWVGPTLYEIELGGQIVASKSKLVASRARLLRRVGAWDDDLRAAYSRMCAERAHELALRAAPALEAWDALVEPARAEGPAVLGFIAARIAEEITGPAAYQQERALQARWLAERLGLKD